MVQWFVSKVSSEVYHLVSFCNDKFQFGPMESYTVYFLTISIFDYILGSF